MRIGIYLSLVRFPIALLVVAIYAVNVSGQSENVENVEAVGTYDRAGYPKQSRSVSFAMHGMAATSDLRSTQAAVAILQAGGSAVDAAIAANAVLGVVEPMSCGMGGDLFAICWSPGFEKPVGLNASGRAPQLATLDAFRERGLEDIPTIGPLAWSVPGCVAGWHDLHQRYGRLAWAKLFEPAIQLAEEGFPVAPVIAGYWKGGEERLAETVEAASTRDRGFLEATATQLPLDRQATQAIIVATQTAAAEQSAVPAVEPTATP